MLGTELSAYLTQLVALFNAHTHPAETVLGFIPVTPMLPVPPMQPPTPNILSRKVALE